MFYFRKWGAMGAPTAIADIIDPEVLADQISAKFPENLVFAQVPNLVEVDTTFPLGSPGSTFTMPFWKRIGAFGAMSEGTPLTVNKITASKEQCQVQRAGLALGTYDTAGLVSKADPMTEIAAQIGRRAAEYIDAKLVLQADRTPNAVDATGTTYNTGGTLDDAVIIDSLVSKVGDQYGKMIAGGVLIMHSKPFGDLIRLGKIQNQYQSGMNVLQTGMISTLLGMPIFLSDRVTVASVSSVNHYNTYVVSPGQLALFYQRQVRVEFDRDPLAQEDIIVSTVHFATHLFGWDDVTNAQAAEDTKSFGIVKIKTK
jgi:hypothetical protein